MDHTELMRKAENWFNNMGWKPFPFQYQAWQAYLAGQSGLVNAPTGSGKTYSLVVPILLEFIRNHGSNNKNTGLQALWITPIRALAKEIELSATRAIEGLGLPWKVGVRSGDTLAKERERQKTKPPEFLIITPESLHLLLAQKGYADFFRNLKVVVADEWHELMGSKRGVQVELALSRLKPLAPQLKVWGISATIGNMDQALEMLLGEPSLTRQAPAFIKADQTKKIDVISIFPDSVETMPWAGHLGIQLLDKVVEIVKQSTSTLIFTNTRSFAEIWYQKMLDKAPELSGLMA
ncbi:MAG: DEAD/DEAH box helicase, partial [Cyclobacteriaceae bacterium]